jgi:hypothetical protein
MFNRGHDKYVEQFGARIAFRQSENIDDIDAYELWDEFYASSNEYDAYVCFGVLRFCKTKLAECPPLEKVKSVIRALSLNPTLAKWQIIKLALLKEDRLPNETPSYDFNGLNQGDRNAINVPNVNEQVLPFNRVLNELKQFVAWYSRGQSRLFFESSGQVKGVMSAWLRGNSALLPASISLVDMTETQARSVYRYLAVKMYQQWMMNTDEFSFDQLMYSDLLTDLSERSAIYEHHLDNVTERTDRRIETDWHTYLLHFKNPVLVQAVFNCLHNKLLDERLSEDLPGLMHQINLLRGITSIDQLALDLVPVEFVLLKQLDEIIKLNGRIPPRIENKLLKPIKQALVLIKSWCAISRPNIQIMAEYTAAIMEIFELHTLDRALSDMDWGNLLSSANLQENDQKPKCLEDINGEPVDVNLYPGKEFEADWPAKGDAYPEYDAFNNKLEENAAYVMVYALEKNETNISEAQGASIQAQSLSGLRLNLTNYHYRIAAKRAGETLDIPVFVAPKKINRVQGLSAEVLCVVIDGSSSMFNKSVASENSAWERVKKMMQGLYDRADINVQDIHLYVAHDWGRQSIDVYPLNLGGQFDGACFDNYQHKGIRGFRYAAIYRHFHCKYGKQNIKTKFLFLTDTGMQYIGWGYEKLLKIKDENDCLICDNAKTGSCGAESSEPDIGLVEGEVKSVAMYLPFGYGLEDLNHALTAEGESGFDSDVSVWFLGDYNVQPLLDKYSKFPGMCRWLGVESDDMTLIAQW